MYISKDGKNGDRGGLRNFAGNVDKIQNKEYCLRYLGADYLVLCTYCLPNLRFKKKKSVGAEE